MSTGRVFLIPNLISDTSTDAVIPKDVSCIAIGLRHFVVENEKVARRYLKKLDRSIDINALTFYKMGKHAEHQELHSAVKTLQSGMDVGVISDAGCPGVADPGAVFVQLAHRDNIEVIPFVGPSSILLTLMSSGLNGQKFTFHGYAPKDASERKTFLSRLSHKARNGASTELLMDTPFRNEKLLHDLLNTCPQDLLLCIGKDVTGERGWVRTKSIATWKKQIPSLNKIPVIYALGY